MIGNDIVDLVLAQQESNWQRKGFLDKIFTNKEQLLIANTIDPELMVWNLWSRKEAAYKIYNRQTGFRGYIPLQLECNYEDRNLGTVFCNGHVFFTNTQISNEHICTIAVANKEYFSQIFELNSETKISKTNGIPYLIDEKTKTEKPVSISHHGRFSQSISLL
jgi:phosphopantetheinyl transferase (holo-ACP synthase)